MGRAKPVALEGNRARHIVWDAITQVDILVKEPKDASGDRLVLAPLPPLRAFLRNKGLDRRREPGLRLQEATNPAASDAFEYDACVPVRESRHL